MGRQRVTNQDLLLRVVALELAVDGIKGWGKWALGLLGTALAGIVVQIVVGFVRK